MDRYMVLFIDVIYQKIFLLFINKLNRRHFFPEDLLELRVKVMVKVTKKELYFISSLTFRIKQQLNIIQATRINLRCGLINKS